ncbi:hypothetical protein GQ54DRAFT_341030 [Martensiomyces pterosporus]|nr:hypothetical protein GQ54DRAFT_341030 [Martensiomyces pterosporus]
MRKIQRARWLFLNINAKVFMKQACQQQPMMSKYRQLRKGNQATKQPGRCRNLPWDAQVCWLSTSVAWIAGRTREKSTLLFIPSIPSNAVPAVVYTASSPRFSIYPSLVLAAIYRLSTFLHPLHFHAQSTALLSHTDMRWRKYLSLLPVMVQLPWTAYGDPGSARNDSPDDQADTSRYSGGILLKHWNQTSCELAPVDNLSAFVAASCLDMSSVGKNLTGIYQVYLESQESGVDPRTFDVENITVHPSYNNLTMANNVALLQFNSKQRPNNIDMFYSIEGSITNWPALEYVRIAISADMQTRSIITSGISSLSSSADCKNSSSLYRANENAFLCSSLATTTASKSSCSLPFGSVRGKSKDDSAVVAIYSHSAVYGTDDLCQKGVQEYSYYTLLPNYYKWAYSVINGTSIKAVYSMAPANATSIKGVTVVGGDLYSQHSVSSALVNAAHSQEPPALPKPMQTGDAHTNEPTETDGGDSDSDSDELKPTKPAEASSERSSGGLSSGQRAGVGVGAALGAIVLTVALFFLYKSWKKRRLESYWDREVEHMQSQKALTQPTSLAAAGGQIPDGQHVTFRLPPSPSADYIAEGEPTGMRNL